MEAVVSAAWWLVALVGVATIAIKGAGPVLLGGKPLPPRIGRIIGLLAPALLAALVAISTFGGDRALVLDERAAGVGAAAVAVALKAPPLVVVVVAAVVTAATRTLV
jgi:branched-subunit amino acid transport protein